MLFFILLSCTEKNENFPPSVSLNIQEEDLKLIEDYEVYLQAEIADPNNEPEELSVRWLVGGLTACDWTLGGTTCSYAIGFEQVRMYNIIYLINININGIANSTSSLNAYALVDQN